MKKLLVLVLVCALASVANATLNLSLVDNGDGTFGIQQTGTFSALPSPAYGDSTNFIVASSDALAFPSGGTITAAAPVNSYINDGPAGAPVPEGMDGAFGWIGTILTTGQTDTAGGVYINNIHSAIGDTVVLFTMDPDWNAATEVARITLVPEPMTMGLLGLGALFLRRRK